jgi:mannose-6-phosphate isomerase-like protein (cupin superfamily)
VQYRRTLGPSLFTSNWAYIDQLLVPAGAATSAHSHPGIDEFYYATDGGGKATVGSETAAIRKGEGIVVRMGEVHAFENTGSAPLEFLILGVAKDKAVLDTVQAK